MEIDGTSSSIGAQPNPSSVQRAFDASTFEEEKARLVERSTYLETAILVRGDQYHATDETFGMLKELRTEFGRASAEIHSDRPTILAVMSANGELLELCREGMKDDFEVVERAVRRSPWSLKWASQRLRDDRAIVLTAVRGDGASFRFASKELRSDCELIKEACRSSCHGVTFASCDRALLANDMEVQAAFLECRTFSRDPPAQSGMRVAARDSAPGVVRMHSYRHFLDNLSWLDSRAVQHRQPSEIKDFWLMAARRAPPGPDGLDYLRRLAKQVNWEWLSWDNIWRVSLSKLADPGHVAPRLTVEIRAAEGDRYECEVTTMSGKTFTFQMPTFHEDAGTSDPTPGQKDAGPQVGPKAQVCPAASNVGDLAQFLIELLPVHTDVQDAKFVSIIFAADDDEIVPVTAWDWNLPLANFARSF